MFKELQKQIEQKKRELVQPTKEKFEQIFNGYKVEINLDAENNAVFASMSQEDESGVILLNFQQKENQKIFSNYGVAYEKDGKVILAAKPMPFTIEYEVIAFVFYELNSILEGLKTEETEVEPEVETKEEE